MSNEDPLCDYIVWIDLEMSGLDPENDVILETATIVTDNQLNIISPCETHVIGQPAELFERMDAWNKKHHSASGLWKKVLESTTTIDEAEQKTFDLIKKYAPKAKVAPLAGNSVWQDRRFIRRYMPKIDEHLHYRVLDISALKILCKLWYPDSYKFPKKDRHRAEDDIIESIAELSHYRKMLLVDPKTKK